MKVFLTLAAASVILAGNSVYAQNDPVQPTGFVPKITFSTQAQQFTQADGTFLTVDGGEAWIIDSGRKVAAANGDHDLLDGKVISVKDGKVTSGLPERGIPPPKAAQKLFND